MTRKKKAFPDIDSDFGDRDKAVKLLQEFFGDENVIPVSNFAALKPLSLIKDLCKLYAVPFEEVNKYTTTMIPEVMAVKKAEPGFDAAQYELTFEDLAEAACAKLISKLRSCMIGKIIISTVSTNIGSRYILETHGILGSTNTTFNKWHNTKE